MATATAREPHHTHSQPLSESGPQPALLYWYSHTATRSESNVDCTAFNFEAITLHTTLKPTSIFIFLRKCPSASVYSPSTWREPVPHGILELGALLRCPALPCPPHNSRKEYTVLHSVYFTYCTDPKVHGAPASVPVCQCQPAKPLPDPAKVPSSLRSAIRRLTCVEDSHANHQLTQKVHVASRPLFVPSKHSVVHSP